MLSGSCRLGRRGLLLALLAATVSGCAPAPGPLPPVPAHELLRAIYSTPGATMLQARGRIQVTTPGGGFSGGLLLFYRDPDSLRVIIQGGIGAILAEVALTGATGIAYLPQQKQAFQLTTASALVVGDATIYPSMFARLLRPVESERFGDSASIETAGGSYYVRSRSASGLRTWQINGRTRQLEAEDFASAEETVEWHRRFETERNVRAPTFISVRLGDTTTIINLARISVSPAWRGNEFRVRLPPDVDLVDLEREGSE